MSHQVLVCIVLALTAVYGSPLVEDRIFGGEDAHPGQFPHQVSLRLLYNNVYQHMCGGSIISDRFILTSGYCFRLALRSDDRSYRVVVGAQKNGGDEGKAYDVRNIMIHEDFDDNLMINDIALVEVNEPIVFGENVAPIRLHRTFIDDAVPAVTSGWGPGHDKVLDLTFANLTTMSYTACVKQLGDLDEPRISEFSHLCGHSGKPGTGICSGDTGGPLVYNNELIGVTSFAYWCGSHLPDVFTRISAFTDWIDARVGSTEN